MIRSVTLSVVSHNQADLVSQLLKTIDQSGAGEYLEEVIVTNNLPDKTLFHLQSSPIKIIDNLNPKGFGQNHNEAFKQAKGKFFCVVNPDILLDENPIPALLNALEDAGVGVAAPFVFGSDNIQQDNLRHFPTVLNFFKRLMKLSDGRFPLGSEASPFKVDWAAGMFLAFKSIDYEAIDGFDEKFFLYYEDVDICLRMWLSGRQVVACPQAKVIHEAQKSSHKKLKFLCWHIKSLLRYFCKYRLGLAIPRVN